MKLHISIIIFTYNEEKNIENCLKSIHDWVEDIFIVGSYSTDKTSEVVGKYTDKIYQKLLEESGFKPLKFYGSGRVPYLWKAMVIVARRM